MRKPLGLIDMDNTLCDYTGQLAKDMARLAASGESCDPFSKEPWMQARADLIKSQPGWWRNLPEKPLGFEVLAEAQKIGFDVEVLTKGPYSKPLAWGEKVQWIQDHLGMDATVNIVGRNKSYYYGRFLCDDYPDYLSQWLAHRPRGLGILIPTPYNRGFLHPLVICYDGTDLPRLRQILQAVHDRGPKEDWRDLL
jgi:5'(3')-deoxyribonucleotidase